MVDIRLNSLPCFRTLDGCQQANRPTRILAITKINRISSFFFHVHSKVEFSEITTFLSEAFSVTVNC
jgi:hypothetical protein